MNLSLNLTPDPDSLDIDTAIDTYKDIKDGFTSVNKSLVFKDNKFKAFIAEVMEEFPDVKIYDYTRSKGDMYVKYFGDTVRIYSQGNAMKTFASVYTKSEEMSLKLWNMCKKHTHADSDIDIFIHSYFMATESSLDVSSKSIKYTDLDYLSKNYYPYIDIDLMLDQFFTGSENIILVVGEPGLGKCLHGDEEIEIYVDDDTYDMLVR